MASIIQFVNSIAASPTVRLDLNSLATSGLVVNDKGIDLSPPQLITARASTMLQDGETIAGAKYSNREIRLPLQIVAQTADAAATILQNLTRELDRPQNILKVQLHGASSPVFFRTFRSDYEFSMLRLLLTQGAQATLSLEAEYAGYGPLETPISAATLSTDPAAGSNGCFVDVTGVKGDVEAPAIIEWPAGAVTSGSDQALFAVRRRGTPSSAPFLIQAEAMTQGTDTTTQANDAAMSGAGNNYSRCTFTTATMATRLSVAAVGSNGVDLRGRYRVFLRYRRSSATGTINVQLLWGRNALEVTNEAASPLGTTTRALDLGEINIPHGRDPVTSADGVELSVSNTFNLLVQAERTSGTSTLDFDFLILVPADDRLARVKWNAGSVSGLDHYLLDARDNNPVAYDSSDRVFSLTAAAVDGGGLPFLSPNQANRLYMLRTIDPGVAWNLTTFAVSVSYHPRYLSVRPAST